MYSRSPFIPKADVKLGELHNCIYCDNSLPSSSKEHFFNASWGGYEASGRLVCNECNHHFGHSIDIALMTYSEMLVNITQVDRQRAGIPIIDLGSQYELTARGKPALKESEIHADLDQNDALRIKGKARNKTELKRWLFGGDLEREIGRALTAQERESLVEEVRNVHYIPNLIGTQTMSIAVNLTDEYRSATHTLLKCLARSDPGLVQSHQLVPLREFVRHSRGKWEDFAVATTEINLPMGGMILDRLSLAPANICEIYYSHDNCIVVGILTLLSTIQRAVILSSNYDGPSIARVCYEVAKPYGTGGVVDLAMDELEAFQDIPLVQVSSTHPSIKDILEASFKAVQGRLDISPVYSMYSLLNRKDGPSRSELPRMLDSALTTCTDSIDAYARHGGFSGDRDQVRSYLLECNFPEASSLKPDSIWPDIKSEILGAVLKAMENLSSFVDRQ